MVDMGIMKNMIHVEKSDNCTGCCACISTCPVNCIEIQYSNLGDVNYPVVDDNKCVKCGKCVKACQLKNELVFEIPSHTYAGYSRNDEVFLGAASGGIASEIYRYALDKKIFAMGTKFSREKGVFFQCIEVYEDILSSRDSKYVYSNARDIFENYKKALTYGKSAVYIGLPCQVAALLLFLKANKVNDDELITVDLICHGTPSWKYLNEHLLSIEQKKHKKIDRIRFRDPIYIYFFRAITKNGSDIYSKNT